MAPLSGRVVGLEQIPDQVFSQKMLGDGFGIEPNEYKVVSPFAATVIAIPNSKHALTLKNKSGLEILIHVGMETVALQGKGFTLLVQEGQEVEAGTPLLEFDPFVLIERGATSLISAVVFTDTENWQIQQSKIDREVKAGHDTLFVVSAKYFPPTSQEPPFESEADSQNDTLCMQAMVINPQGIHARPAAIFATAAKQFASEIKILGGRRVANAKSPLSLMAADIPWGSSITIEACGEDRKEAVNTLLQLLAQGLGETPRPIVAIAETTNANEAKGKPDVMREQKGLTAAAGFAVGEAFIYSLPRPEIRKKSKGRSEELKILEQTLQACESEITSLIARVRKQSAQENLQDIIDILQAHLALLTDEDLLQETKQHILSGFSAPAAYANVVESKLTILQNLPNPILAERAIDLKDVEYRMLQKFSSANKKSMLVEEILFNAHDHAQILIAEDLTPSEFIKLTFSQSVIAAICLVKGSPGSHTSILASNAGIPMIVKLGEQILNIPEKTSLIVAADTGTLKISPAIQEYTLAQKEMKVRKKNWPLLLKKAQEPVSLKDGFVPVVAGNCESPTSAAKAFSAGADALGLVRSEFIFSKENQPPYEETQFSFYSQIMQAAQGKSVVFRTLDVGGDKPMPYLPLPRENNPLLGLRGIRVSLFSGQSGEDLFRSQVRAILRLQPYEARKILLPMISDISELIAAKKIIEEERKNLHVPSAEVGIMIEIPSAALMAEELAKSADFFSIGSNDLSQYVLAVDRTNSLLSDKLMGIHPALLALINITAKAANKAGIPAALCGNLASHPQMAALLLGLGIYELSMAPPMIPLVKETLRQKTLVECEALSARALQAKSKEELQKLLF